MIIQTHGIGGSQDLPISPILAIAGAVAALTISFTVLAVAWRKPRYSESVGDPAPRWLARLVDSAGWAIALRVLGLLLFGYLLWVTYLGPDLLTNPAFGMFYVLLWVGLVPVSLAFGPVWKAISPTRTISRGVARLARTDPETGLVGYRVRLGYWPAALGLFAFVWTELVSPRPDELGTIQLWIGVYLAVMLVGGALGGQQFHEHVDPFEVYSTLVSRMSFWGRRHGELVVRSPMANLAMTPVRPGLVAVVAVLFGSTAFDSFKDSPEWLSVTQSSSSPYLLNNLALIGFCLAVGAIFAAGTMATGVGPETRRRDLPGLFAHSVAPIVIGYVVAHYLSFLVIVGQTTLIQMSDPMGNGSNLLGTADWSVNYWLLEHPTLLANTKVLAVVTGHILGVIAAHDRAISLLPKRHQLTGQLPLLFAMVAFTVGGLYLLFAS
ncbi:hypothetical protein [Nocardioides sp.]|uniref:hypothetical protein n=1 Tax=Nocardioides sp. TaxID=35761 RepID=UPI00352781F4